MSEMMRKRRPGRVDIGVAHHEFFEDVVLDRAGQLGVRHALFLGGDDIERQHRQHRAVHGHRHAHLVERDAGEQRAHVVDRVDRDARHADVAGYARMVAVIAAMGGEIEGDREALLSGGEIAPVEGVGIFRRREAGILPDGPGLRRVHRGIGPAQERCLAGIGVEEIDAGEIGVAIIWLYRDAFRRRSRARRRGRMARRPRRSRAWRSSGPDSFDAQNIMRSLQGRNHVAAHEYEGFDAGRLPLASWSPGRPARWTMAPAVVNALAASAASLLIDVVGRAQAGKFGARCLESGEHLCLVLEAVIAQRLDAAGLIEILGKHRPRGEVRDLAEHWPGTLSAARRSWRSCGRRRRAASRMARTSGCSAAVR